MNAVSALIIGTSALGSLAGFSTSTPDSPKGVDDFEYAFKSDSSFEKTNGDEFEILDAEHGGRSGLSFVSADGDEEISKSPNKTQAVSYDVFRKQEPSILYTSVYTDVWEGNDSFGTATNVYSAGQDSGGIYKHSVWLDATISQKSSGWWLWKKTYVDKDFYSFDAVCCGTLTVTLSNIPKNCDYDLRAYRLSDGPDSKASALSFDKHLQSSSWGSNYDEKITLSVTPGTYYFCVYSYQDKTFDNENPYHLLFEEQVNTSRANTSYWISSGKAKGDLGAIWVSDYKPLGYTPVTLRDNDAVVKVTNYGDYPYIRHLADKYTGEEYINYAIVFVWDPSTRACISAVAQRLIEIVDKQTDWQDNQSKSINIGMNTTGLVLTVAGAVIGTIGLAATGGVAAAALAAAGIVINAAALPVSMASFAMSFQSNAPYLSTRKDLLAYLVSVQQTFAVGKGSNSNETKILRYRYRFDKDSHSLNWSPFYLASDYNFYNENYISFQIQHSGIDGTIKGFKTESDLKSYLGA